MNYRNYFNTIYKPDMLEPTRTSMVLALKDELIDEIKTNEALSKQEIDETVIAPTAISEDYLSIKACESNVRVKLGRGTSAATTAPLIQYRKLNTAGTATTSWTLLEYNTYDTSSSASSTYSQEITQGTIVTLNSGETVQYRNQDERDFCRISSSSANFMIFRISGYVESFGNIMTLCDKRGYQNYVGQYGFFSLFANCTGLTTAPEMPAEYIEDYSYYRTFYNCTHLKKAPSILPALTLKPNCYYEMFRSSIISATPIIMGVTTATTCYKNMFYGCTHLKEIFVNLNWTAAAATTGWVTSVPTAATWGGTFHKRASSSTTGVNWSPRNWTQIADMSAITHTLI